MKKIQKLVVLTICIMMLAVLSLSVSAFAETYADIKICSADVTTGQDKEFTTTVYVEENSAIAGLMMTLTYDEDVVSFVSAKKVDASTVNVIGNEIYVNFTESENVNERVDLVELTFKTNEQIRTGTTTGWLKKLVKSDDESFTYDDNYDFVDVGVVCDFGDIKIRKIGDAYDNKGDGKINVKDASYILQHVAHIITIPDDELIYANAYSADDNADGTPKINVKDASAILQYVAHVKNTLGDRYDVIFYDENGVEIFARSVKAGDSVNKIPAILGSGVWSLSQTEYVAPNFEEITAHTNVYIYVGSTEPLPTTYTVNFDLNGGEGSIDS
ncbi:MAG: hypothetical protein IJF76_01990, partial [Clostridia bacterium]|nr:hypothetical protein [Clostridia bacterium]